jgi:glycyl-tRNA synthetase
VLDTARKKLPFGIAQIGKAFRNEINPRNFIFRRASLSRWSSNTSARRSRDAAARLLARGAAEVLRNIGIPRAKLHVLNVPDADRAFYSKGTYDIEYEFRLACRNSRAWRIGPTTT